MELRQLEYFVAVAEEASFTRAADRVHISQSGVSAQIRQLERTLGAALFDRSGRTARLTPAGEAALEHARAALASADSVSRAVGEVLGLVRGRLVVGMVIGCTVAPLFAALATFHRAHPGVDVVLLEGNSHDLIDEVRTGAIDLALVGIAGAVPEGLGSLTVVSERIVAAVPLDHPLARRSRVRIAELAGYPVVCMPEGTGTRTVFDRACAAADVTPTVVLQASAAAAVADLAGRGLGIAILSESMTAQRDDLRTLRITDATEPALLALAWSTTPTRALAELVRHSRQAFA